MDTSQSLEILKSLANGVDPTSGEIFSLDSPYNHPLIIRALFGCIEQIKFPPRLARTTKRSPEQKQADNLAKGLPRNVGMPWTEQLSRALAEQFNAGTAANELAVQFERTLGAIVAQLKKQGLISEEEARRY